MSQSKMTRRKFGYLFPLAAISGRLSLGQVNSEIECDGQAWKTANKLMKLGYVLGFVDAATQEYEDIELQSKLLKSLSSVDQQILALAKTGSDYGDIKYGQYIEGMDVFYSDYRNAAIKWERALPYVRDSIHGEPQKTLDWQLELLRKMTLGETRQK